jgi:hypothetical protein
VNRQVLLIDAGIALLIALLVLILTPGVAVAGLLALLVLVVCAISFAVDARRRRVRPAGPRPVRRRPPPSSPPRRASRGR